MKSDRSGVLFEILVRLIGSECIFLGRTFPVPFESFVVFDDDTDFRLGFGRGRWRGLLFVLPALPPSIFVETDLVVPGADRGIGYPRLLVD